MNEETLFHRARAKPVAERATFLGQACGGDADLLRRVQVLLQADDDHGGFMDKPAADLAAAADSQEPGDRDATAGPPPTVAGPGTRVGPYKLLQKIGEGGMGVVFMAEQARPVRRTVALKIIKPGMDSRQVIARFETERQALAMMDHPNVAKVLEAGATESGRPYFVMELVSGVPITRYCDELCLPVHQRLELFVQVCHAIQHAHQKGVIHRDLKPGNVLVALYDDVPVPKVIDFGVAKAAGQALGEATLFTGFGSVVGTVEYMSPEQAGLNQLDVDTRSDVYSLGVLLYELLTGTTPLQPARVKASALFEVLRLVREEEAAKPSTRLDTTKQLPSLAACRGLEPKKLSVLLRGELDWIVMKCLEKDRARRYESASALLADVERYLVDEPVQACPPSTGYQLQKFVRRHKGLVLAAAVVVLALFGGVAGTAWQAVRADHARALAVMERDKKQSALEAETRARKQAMAARGQAMAALHRLTDDVVGWQRARQPAPGSSEQLFLGKVLAHYEEFAALEGDAQQNRFIRAEGNLRVGFLRATTRDADGAGAAFGLAASMFKQLAEDFPDVPDYRRYLALTTVAIGNLRGDAGNPDEAQAAFRDAAAVRRQLPVPGTGAPDYRQYLVRDHGSLVRLLHRSGRLAEAEAEQRLALTLREQLAAESPDVPQNLVDLGRNYAEVGILIHDRVGPEQAFDWFGRAIDTLTPVVASHPRLADARLFLCNAHWCHAVALEAFGRYPEAERDWDRAVELDEGPRRAEFRMQRVMSLAQCEPVRAIAAAEQFIGADPDNLEHTFRCAQILLLAGDDAGYKRLCARQLARRGNLKCHDLPGRESYLLARFCLMAPDAVADPTEPTRLAAESVRVGPNWPHYHHTMGLAHYRAADTTRR